MLPIVQRDHHLLVTLLLGGAAASVSLPIVLVRKPTTSAKVTHCCPLLRQLQRQPTVRRAHGHDDIAVQDKLVNPLGAILIGVTLILLFGE